MRICGRVERRTYLSKFLHVFLHVVAIGLQVVNVAVIPTPYQMPVAAGISLIQGAIAAYNHTTPAPAPAK